MKETASQVTPLMETTEVAEYLGVPVNTLYNWRSTGRGPRAIRVGKYLRYRQADVDRWLEEQADPARGSSVP